MELRRWYERTLSKENLLKEKIVLLDVDRLFVLWSKQYNELLYSAGRQILDSFY